MNLKVFLIVFMVSKCAFSQQNIKHFTTFNGLPHDVTYGLYQDSFGYIWIGTDDGLVKYDGKLFDVINANDGLSSNYVIDINELSDKQLVIATWQGGLNILNRSTNYINQHENGPKKLANLEVYKDTIYNIYDFRNNFFWIENDKITHTSSKYEQIAGKIKEIDISKKYASALKFVNISDSLFAFSEVNSNDAINGVYLKRNGSFKPIFTVLKDLKITALAKHDKAYIAASNNIIFIIENGKIKMKKAFNFQKSKISKIVSLNNNEIAFLTKDYQGVKYAYTYNILTDKLTDINHLYNIKSSISDILLDNEQNLWISTFGDGVYFIENKINTIKTIAINNSVIDFDFYDDSVYASSTNTLFEIDNLNNISEYPLTGIAKQVKTVGDELWINTLNSGYGERNVTIKNKKIKEQYAYRVFNILPYETIVVNNEIRLLNKNKSFEYNKLEFNIFNAFYRNKSLYFGTNRGLYIYNETANRIEKESEISSRIKNCIINASLISKDTLFLGTDLGLWKIYNDSVINYLEKDGLVNNTINTLFLDDKNKLWIGTQNGLSIYYRKSFTNLNQESGLLSSYVSAIKEDNSNKVWISGSKGLSIIDNTISIKLQQPPKLLVTQKASSFFYDNITFNRTQVFTEYKVNNEQWVSLANNKGFLDFSSYKPASYNILFRAKKSDSNWVYSEPFSFKIETPLHKRLWFVFTIALGLSSIALLFILHRLKLSKKRNQKLYLALNTQNLLQEELSNVRENIARDFHDDLGNKLARISMFSDILSEDNTHLDKNNKELITQIHEDSNYVYKSTKDFIFSLKSESNDLEEVVTYISDFAEDYLKSFKITFTVEKDIQSSITLPHYWSKQIIFIFKEALTNSVKHSGCKNIKLTFESSKSLLKISCLDDGTGFNYDNMSYKSGLINIKERAKKIGCLLKINSKKQYGTKIYFEGKLH